ncbi:hypothetical protein ACWKW6_09245 [Dyadobacter jiangsuensis]
MLLFFFIILMIGFCCLGIALIVEQKKHTKFLSRLRQNDRARIKYALDELLQAYNQGILSESEYQQKSDKLIDELSGLPDYQEKNQ